MRKDGLTYYLSHTFIHLIFLSFCILIIIPFILVFAISFTKEADIYTYGYQLIPKNIDITAYKFVLRAPQIIFNAYKISIIITVVGTIIGLLVTAMIGYCISRKDYKYRRFLTFFIIFTMLFNGGLVSYFIIMTKYLHLNNNLLAIILPGLVSAYYVIIMRGFMSDIPLEIIESVKIDGAREFTIFFRVIIPLSKPALATIGLFIAFNYWNEWFNSMLFIESSNLVPLQLLLVRMLNTIEAITSNPLVLKQMIAMGFKLSDFPSLSVRMATAILVIGPMLIVFPFFQRYFVKGMMLGAVKG